MESLKLELELKKTLKKYVRGTVFSQFLCDDILGSVSALTICHTCFLIKDNISMNEIDICNNCQQNGIPIHKGNIPYVTKRPGKYLIMEDIIWRGPGPMITFHDIVGNLTIKGNGRCVYVDECVYDTEGGCIYLKNFQGHIHLEYLSFHKIPSIELKYYKLPKPIKKFKNYTNIQKPYNKRPKW